MSKQYYDENGNPVEVEKKNKRGGCLKWLGIFIGVLVLFGACGVLVSDEETQTQESTTEEVAVEEEVEETEEQENVEEEVEETEVEAEEETEEEPAEDDVPREHRNALSSAENYLNSGMGFSEEGLREQLDFEGYPSDAIDYALENVDVDYNEQAAISAQNYENIEIGFSDQGLIEQLMFDGFTEEQAQYGLDSLN